MLDYFVPSDTPSPLPLLGDLLPRLPPAVARAYVESYSEPGGIVLDPSCAGASVIRAAVESGRRVVAASFNPVVVCAVEAALWPVDARAAFTHLADTRKGERRLADHVLALYAARCPTCGANVVAREFVWERSANAPVFKIVDCHNCGTNGGPADDGDVAAARKHEPRGLPFWLLRGKVIAPEDEDANRVSEALDAYSPRALAAIADILLKYEGLPPGDREALRAPMIGMLDAASLLHPADDGGQPILPRPRPRSLRPAQRFVERNVWLTLESLISSLYSPQQPILRAPGLDALLEARQPAVCLLVEASRDLSKRLPPRSIDLLLARPPLPDPVFWTLSAVWAAWLWGRHEAAPLLPLLSQRRTNWDWQWRAIASALGSLLPALKDEARVVLTFNAGDAPGESALDGVALAIAGSGASLTRILCDPFDGYRIHARPVTRRSADRDRESLAQDISESAGQAAVRTLRARGEPTAWPTLRAAILETLASERALSVVARLPEDGPQPPAFLREAIEAALSAKGAPVVEIESGMWWLVDAGRAGEPLADRVESAAAELLRSKVEWDERELLSEVYRRFPGDLTPERPLVAECIVSYTEEAGRLRVRLRSEDHADARAAEIQSMQAALAQLGAQLGYAAEARAGQIVWKEDGSTAYTLVVSSMATMGAMWLHGQMLAGTPVLVIPGSRATLFQHKLARDARLREAVERGAWQFLKFSAVREMIAHADMDRRAFALALGLDPPLEKPQVQIPLW
ncbi:MAG TPA: hypothetical protein VFL17_11780 [Anaerolineae bacterium]|nr:hypothetical protein [Anaerolineae bacterium]